ncbi:hypothetical protein [Glycomyces terrestris]|uniref:Uncharacterized protein n=1 Tax=Glycomyces terrestris TaxID=2493553 RepID=A0A426V397_9ACTN|nr:hypothetical protein [Glycomyces terrestris]RRS01379.1 hypothetical protein EIW28_00970 [Glycomyces terrestris]
MSLLSDLIAELSSLIERSRESSARVTGAGNQLEQVFTAVKESTTGSNSAAAADGLGHLRHALQKIDEAHGLLSAGAERFQEYISVLRGGSGPGAVVAPRARPPLGTGAARSESKVRGPARTTILPPTPGRHRLTRIGRKSLAKGENTVILPHVDVEGDLEAIRTGRAPFDAATGRYAVNGRTWAVKGNGRAFPVSGPGLVELTRPQFKALMSLNDAQEPIGVWPKNYLRDQNISAADWDRAAEVYRYHPRHNQGGP